MHCRGYIRKRHRGIMLVECLIYISSWTVVTGLAFAAFYQYWDNSRALQHAANDIVQTLKVGEKWRADIRSATGKLFLENEGNEQALHIPKTGGEVVYLFSLGKIWRLTINVTTNGTALVNVGSSRMIRDPRSRVTAWRWEVELPAHKKTPHIRPLFSFEAVAKDDQ